MMTRDAGGLGRGSKDSVSVRLRLRELETRGKLQSNGIRFGTGCGERLGSFFGVVSERLNVNGLGPGPGPQRCAP